VFLLAFFLPPFAVFACGKPIQGAINLCIWGMSFPLLFFFFFPGIIAWAIAFAHAITVIGERTMTRQFNTVADAIRESSPASQRAAPEVPRAASSRPGGDRASSFNFKWTPSHSNPEPETDSAPSEAPTSAAGVSAAAKGEQAGKRTSPPSDVIYLGDQTQPAAPHSERHPARSAETVYNAKRSAIDDPSDEIRNEASIAGAAPTTGRPARNGDAAPSSRWQISWPDEKRLRLAAVIFAYVLLAAALVLFIPEVRMRAVDLWASMQASATQSRAFVEAHWMLLLEIAALIGIGGIFAGVARKHPVALPGLAACLLLLVYQTFAEFSRPGAAVTGQPAIVASESTVVATAPTRGTIEAKPEPSAQASLVPAAPQPTYSPPPVPEPAIVAPSAPTPAAMSPLEPSGGPTPTTDGFPFRVLTADGLGSDIALTKGSTYSLVVPWHKTRIEVTGGVKPVGIEGHKDPKSEFIPCRGFDWTLYTPADWLGRPYHVIEACGYATIRLISQE